MTDVYQNLAGHLAKLSMGYPASDALPDLLKSMFTPVEAEVALAMSANLLPLEVEEISVIAARAGISKAETADLLAGMAAKKAVYSAPTPSGRTGYALHQVGYGMPQAYLWQGPEGKTSTEMARRIVKYFSVPVTREVYGKSPTKSYKYAPVGLTVDVTRQGVLPHDQIRTIIEAADRIGLAHCPCRTSARVLGRTDCRHSLEVCFKYDEMADFVIEQGLARRVSADEALSIMQACEKEGLVHMVDNAQGDVKHTCNCCGHYCWNVGIIARKRVPRDVLMSVYYLRKTEPEACIGCGACAEICPVQAVTMDAEDRPVVAMDWCIGCGVCMVSCPGDAITMVPRSDNPGPKSFTELHRQIRLERSQGTDP
ncbi:MAG: 4Fe-4S binding protein [Deltaproteobacteria bacterium]|jgi:Pyruvate/2-oxoacid:ferredoxin oxidoreductase delta subunit